MDFAWDPAQQALYEQTVQFARQALGQGLAERDLRGEFDRTGWQQCGGHGLLGLTLPTQWGGRGLDPLSAVAALEGLGYGCADNGLALAIGAHLWGCAMPLLEFGDPTQQARWLPDLASGKRMGALAISEPAAGSDALALTTSASVEGEGYRLDGHKVLITNAPLADLFLVLARVDASKGAHGLAGFLIERGTPGLEADLPQPTQGMRTAGVGELRLNNCWLPASHRLGLEGAGMAIITEAMGWERGLILAPVVGAMQRQLEQAIAFARQRRQFGQAISQFQWVAGRLVEMRLRLEQARGLLYRYAWLKGREQTAHLEAAMCKLTIGEAWLASSRDALQIQGGHGYLAGSAVERDLRDATASTLYSGTSELQRRTIAQWLGLG